MSNEKKKRECPICGTKLSEDDEICPNCGAYIEEPAYDIENDLEDEE